MTPPSLEELLTLDRNLLWHPYSAIQNTDPMYLVESAHGSQLQLATGQKLVDGMSSWWSVIHGYNNAELNQALVDQSKKMAHVMFGGLTHEPAIQLAKSLIDITPQGLDHVFFADSGSVGVEVALKMALQYWFSLGKPEKHKILSFFHGYHGDTFGAMSVCDPVNGMHHLFSQFLPQQLFAHAPPSGFDADIQQEAIDELREIFASNCQELAAVIIEPVVQGAGGMRIYNPGYLNALKMLCDEFDVLLIFDEIATGFGRTGKLFASEHANMSPDILCLGKAITGGYLSFAATLCSHTIAQTINSGEAKVLMHGPTFMGNPLACSLANKSIELLLQSDWKSRIEQIENELYSQLKTLQNLNWVQDIRCLGAIGVIELTKPVNMARITQLCVDHGIWLRPFGKLVYTMPPYVITDEELSRLTNAMVKVIETGDIF